MPRVVHFELPADDPERATRFYRDVFGWQIQKWEQEDYWLVETGKDEPGINGGILRRNPGQMVTTNTLGVPSVDEYVDKITAAGGKVVAPKMAVPTVGYLAYCQDTEGNVFGIMQSDTSAA